MAKINVLIFPAGEINSVELHSALSTCVNIKVFGASSIERHGSYVFENYISNVPMINSPDFFSKFNELLDINKIDVIFPTHDTIATFFADNLDKIKAKVIVADKKTSQICRDKEKTYRVLDGFSFVPLTYKELSEYPVFIKLKEGQGSVGAFLANSKEDIPEKIDLSKYVICEYLPGVEYTVDCLTDKDGNLIVISPRSRDRVMAGVCVAGKTEIATKEIEYIAQSINEKMSFLGLWFFQIKKDKNGKWKLLEISTRCAGTMCLTRSKGVNLPLLSVYVAMGYPVKAEMNNYNVEMDRTLISRYKLDYQYENVYFDYDDTLITNGKVNLNAIRFLYQCKNTNKRVFLITKHSGDLLKDMEKHSIPKSLFYRIIHLGEEENKTGYISPEKAIFIDNAFKERDEISNVHKIPVFDVDGIEFLLDWRM